MKRVIAHIDLDTFFVSVERLRDPSLIGKPILVGGGSDRGVVAACSYEARKFGVHSAMPMKTARRLCPHATIVSTHFEDYSHYSRTVTQIIRESVPLFEKASIDEFYIDLTGMEKHFGCSVFMKDLKNRITKETGLPISYALSANKLVSKIATNEAKPNGEIEIPWGEEKNFLAPLSIDKIPMIGEKTSANLKRLGIHLIRHLAEMQVEKLEEAFGKWGVELWRRANGIDDSTISPFREQKSISTESTFGSDTDDLEFLHKSLVRMTQEVAIDLRRHNRLAGTVTLKLRYSDFETVTRQCSIPYTSADHIIIPRVKELFSKLYEPGVPIRLLGVRVNNLIAENQQIDLFHDAEDFTKLYKALDSVNQMFGKETIVRASGLKKENGK